MRIHLVRHGRSDQRPDVHPRHWRLRDDAAAGIAVLRESGILPGGASWYSSPEPKALATARLLTSSPVQVLPDLRERELLLRWYETETEFAAIVERGMQVPDQPADLGWETSAAATARVRAALDEIVRRDPADAVVLVGHGTAWTLLVAALTGTRPDAAAWRRMGMPDHAAIENGRVVRPWGSWHS